MKSKPQRIGILGAGIAGLGCAWFLANEPALKGRIELTLIEKNDYAGGHANTREVTENGALVPVDTGFIVFNRVTYPLLCRLFDELGIEAQPSEMSFSVRHEPDDVEYNGSSLPKLFAQRKNLLRPRFYGFVADVLRFFGVARHAVEKAALGDATLRQFCDEHGLGSSFRRWYLTPMTAALWSADQAEALDFPADAVLRFFHNHGFLGVRTHHQWLTVKGGSRVYVRRLVERLGGVRTECQAREVAEHFDCVKVRTSTGELLRFDKVVLATHADEALALLTQPEPMRERLLGAFTYRKNHATLHTWPGVMPRRKLAWASWNFHVHEDAARPGGLRAEAHYWMNALQRVSENRDYFVSLNCEGRIPPEHVLWEGVYTHPQFTIETQRAQSELPQLNHRSPAQRVFFCGSYFRHGFHEDALWSAKLCAEAVKAAVLATSPA